MQKQQPEGVYMRNITGKLGETLVVINQQHWKSETGKLIRKKLAQPQVGLPVDEPILDLISIAPKGFGDIFKTTRNILEITISKNYSEAKVLFRENVHAHPQAYVSIIAPDTVEFKRVFNEKAEKILGFFIKAERERLAKNYNKYKVRNIKQKMEEKIGVSISVPSGFKITENRDDFVWLLHDTPDMSQGIFIYWYPYTSDSAFTQKELMTKRNLILKHNVPGPTKGSFMQTDLDEMIYTNQLQHNGNYAVEARGLWRVANDFMGGPFVSLSVLDLLNQRVVCFDAYVYAPGKEKRNYIWQLESMIYSSSFVNQAEIDKLNKQYE